MAKKKDGWPEAKNLCRLNQNDIAMAKSLGFHPDALIRARPDPKQKWKLPVKYWIHELHFKRFGFVVGEKPEAAPLPVKVEYDEEEARSYGEQLYWEDYWERNEKEPVPKKKSAKPAPAPAPANKAAQVAPWASAEITDDDVPF